MRTLEKFEASVPIATADIKHSPTPSHIHVNPHTRDLRIWLSVSKYNLSGYQQGVAKSKEKQSEETNKSLELNLDMTQTLKLSDKGIAVMNVSRSLMESIDNMQEKMDNISREINILRKKQILEIKTLREIKNFFDLVSRVYI